MADTKADTNNKFSKSVRVRVPLRADRNHTLKHHFVFGTVLYELIGALESVPSVQQTRFFFGDIGVLTKLCNKGPRANRKRYTKRHIKSGLAELRARHIVSSYFTVTNPASTYFGRSGFVVAPHDSLCYQVGNECVLHAPKQFECSDAEAARLKEEGNTPGKFFPIAVQQDQKK